MIIERTSNLTGKKHIKEIDVTQDQLESWHNGALIQFAMPNLSASDREFLMTGITNDEWNEAFKDSKQEDEYQSGTQADAFKFQFKV